MKLDGLTSGEGLGIDRRAVDPDRLYISFRMDICNGSVQSSFVGYDHCRNKRTRKRLAKFARRFFFLIIVVILFRSDYILERFFVFMFVTPGIFFYVSFTFAYVRARRNVERNENVFFNKKKKQNVRKHASGVRC